ncbi:MAG: hypothetical protein IJ471_00620 [Eubacterium sp.]|nr:hypothetical protein [Eubacterium sp.]
MAYVTADYYSETFKGEPVADADFPSLLSRAEEIIEALTMYRVTADTLPLMSADTQERVKKAVCAQIEYLDANGGSDMDTGDGLQSAGLGKFNYSKATSADGSTTQSIYAPRAMRILAPTGLLYRGGGCY